MVATRVTNASSRDNPDYDVYTFTGPSATVIPAAVIVDSDGVEYTPGQKTSAESSSVVLSSDHPTVPVDAGEVALANSGIIADLYTLLRQVVNLLINPIWQDPTTGRVNINNATSVTTVTTVSTVSSVSNVAALGGYDPRVTMLQALENSSWAQLVRSKIV